MGVKAFLCPQTGNEISLADAPAYFEQQGLLPADVTQNLVNDINDHRRQGPYLSPSICEPSSNCRREILLKKYSSYVLDPLVLWDAQEGTFFHKQMLEAGKDMPKWLHDMKIPGPEDEGHPNVRKLPTGQLQLEIFPGVWMAGTADRVSADFSTLIDHKTTKYPWTPTKTGKPKDFWAEQREEWKVQFNLYRLGIEKLTGKPCRELFAWRTYRGSRNRLYTFKKIPIALMSPEELWDRIKEHVTTTVAWMEQAEAILTSEASDTEKAQRFETLIRGIPMDGEEKHMFNGQKCSSYCEVRETCFRIQGYKDF